MPKQPLLIPIIHKDVECYQVYEDWSFAVDGVSYTVPQGFVCDGASVPRLLWPFRPPDGTHRAGALAHDWLYANKGAMPERIFSRKECDATFWMLLLEAGVPVMTSWLMHLGVRIGGWYPWSKPKNVLILPVRNAAPFRNVRRRRNHLYAEPE